MADNSNDRVSRPLRPRSTKEAAPRRRRDAAATREAILAAARQAFTDLGYDGAGVREIAAIAGVNAALVSRYFGSKEGLFTVAVPSAFSVAGFLPEERHAFGALVAEHVLTKESARKEDFDPTLALLRSAGNAQAGRLMRDGLEKRFVAPLAGWLGGEHADLRAALVVSVLAGTAVMRDVLRIRPLRRDQDEAVRLLAALLDLLVGKAPSERGGEAPPARKRKGAR